MKPFPLFLLSVVVGIVTLGTILGDRTRTDVLSIEQAPQLQNIIEATLVAGEKTYQVSVPEGSSVYELMVIVQETSDFQFKGKEFSVLGFFVQEINGVAENLKQGTFWIYYINGQVAKVGISAYTVQADDIISWEYENEE